MATKFDPTGMTPIRSQVVNSDGEGTTGGELTGYLKQDGDKFYYYDTEGNLQYGYRDAGNGWTAPIDASGVDTALARNTSKGSRGFGGFLEDTLNDPLVQTGLLAMGGAAYLGAGTAGASGLSGTVASAANPMAIDAATAAMTGGTAGGLIPAASAVGATGATLTAADIAAAAGKKVATGGLLDKAIDLAGSKGGATLIGGLLGAAAGKDTQTTQSSSKDPWGPAQPYLLDNLKTNAAMQQHYQANPFSQEQMAAYQGVMNANANGMANAPVMSGIANNFMGSNRGRMAQMPSFTQGTQAAPINWDAYKNIGLLKG